MQYCEGQLLKQISSVYFLVYEGGLYYELLCRHETYVNCEQLLLP